MQIPRVERNTNLENIGYNQSSTHGLFRGKVALRLSRSTRCILIVALSLIVMVGLGGCGGSAGDGQPSGPGGGPPATGQQPPPPGGVTVPEEISPQTVPEPTETETTPTTESDTTTSPT